MKEVQPNYVSWPG